MKKKSDKVRYNGMGKRLYKKAKDITIGADRLYDNREQYPLGWLLKKQWGGGFTSNLDMIKRAILYMDKGHQNYGTLTYEDKFKAESLIHHEEIVDRVILTIFQWFGTNCGKSDIGKLMDEIRKMEYKRVDYGKKKEDC